MTCKGTGCINVDQSGLVIGGPMFACNIDTIFGNQIFNRSPANDVCFLPDVYRELVSEQWQCSVNIYIYIYETSLSVDIHSSAFIHLHFIKLATVYKRDPQDICSAFSTSADIIWSPDLFSWQRWDINLRFRYQDVLWHAEVRLEKMLVICNTTHS